MSEQSHEYLTFFVAGEEFGIEILAVQEIRVLRKITELPNKPECVLGVINLRGTIIPIVDLRLRFNKPQVDHGDKTVVIILKQLHEASDNSIGIVVDSVSEVYQVAANQVNLSPSFGNHVDHCFIHGLANVNHKLIVLLDSQKIFDTELLYQANPVSTI
ncbi:purine-binding chemotaxis protein CheW [Thalassotalea sp. LPB0316]|uniref:chemotaxis protein CheW n=1 Tax=Thalassotalea sp. LPB0316 TaxID=2769490 RepID=UPI0018666018|nr:chemotaxis protein CheW [Thalassotalea sp. LPB0316]QOL24773.1 purine-binding chemotaxis protein CheW [Thalassotalea sp. LPB0316]